MTAALRKQAERRRRAAKGEVALSGWLSAEDHAALVAMAREAGMTQGQVVSRLIGMRAAVLSAQRWTPTADNADGPYEVWWSGSDEGQWVRHSDLTAAVGL